MHVYDVKTSEPKQIGVRRLEQSGHPLLFIMTLEQYVKEFNDKYVADMMPRVRQDMEQKTQYTAFTRVLDMCNPGSPNSFVVIQQFRLQH